MNGTTPQSMLRELDYRTDDGIEVRLLSNSSNDSVSVSVDDTRYGESFAFDVARAYALEAFRHPFAYAGTDHDPGHNGPSVYPPASQEERTNDDQQSRRL